MPPNTDAKRSIWEGWSPQGSLFLARAQIVAKLRDEYGIDVTREQIEQWESEGLLPPSSRGIYPASIVFLVRALVRAKAQGLDDDEIRSAMRIIADTLDEDDALDTQEKLAEMRESEKQTWEDWMLPGTPEPHIMSRDELLDELKRRNVELTPAGLQYYRHRGIVPRPVRRRHQGVTQAVYPDWMVDAIAHVRELQDQGLSLEQIKPLMRSWALSPIQWRDPIGANITALDGALRGFTRDVGAMLGFQNTNTITVTITDDDGNELFRHEIPYTG